MTIKRSLHIGINYPGTPYALQGCVNDALDWEAKARSRGYRTRTLLDAGATKEAILTAIREIGEQSRWGDRILVTYSGHGSSVPDMNGDEADGRDEVICPVDFEQGRVISDDELQGVLGRPAVRAGVRRTLVLDSCNSGTGNRLVLLPRRDSDPQVIGRIRYVDPSTFLPRRLARAAELAGGIDSLPVRRTIGTRTALLSGCRDDESSYDAWINGRWNGALTATAMWAHELLFDPALGSWYKKIREALPSSDYEQTPQLDASLWQKTWRL